MRLPKALLLALLLTACASHKAAPPPAPPPAPAAASGLPTITYEPWRPDLVTAHLCASEAIIERAAAALPAGAALAMVAFHVDQWKETGRPSRFAYGEVGASRLLKRCGFAIEHVLTRSVRDSAAMLDATAGADPGSPYAAPPHNRKHPGPNQRRRPSPRHWRSPHVRRCGCRARNTNLPRRRPAAEPQARPTARATSPGAPACARS